MCRFKTFTAEAQRTASAIKGVIIVIAFLSVLTPQFACAQGNGQGNGRGNGNSFQQHGKGSQASENQGSHQSWSRGYNSIPGTLRPAPVAQLVRMREEEKLAHDIYVTLAQSSGLQIFNNIANAESQHMRAVEQLAASYSSVAAANLPVGTFSHPQFQALYHSLVAAGSKSPIAAATVGATIEEMDIKDLQTLCHRIHNKTFQRFLSI